MSKRHRRVRPLPGDCGAVLKRQLPNLRAKVRQARQSPPPCLLCGEAVGARAKVYTYTPDDKASWRIPGALLMSCVYTLCPACSPLEDVQPRVLAIIWREWQEEVRARGKFRWN